MGWGGVVGMVARPGAPDTPPPPHPTPSIFMSPPLPSPLHPHARFRVEGVRGPRRGYPGGAGPTLGVVPLHPGGSPHPGTPLPGATHDACRPREIAPSLITFVSVYSHCANSVCTNILIIYMPSSKASQQSALANHNIKSQIESRAKLNTEKNHHTKSAFR